MIIQKVINNNVVSTFDMNNHEVILMGRIPEKSRG